MEVCLADFTPRDEAIHNLSDGSLQHRLNIPAVACLLGRRDSNRVEEECLRPALARGGSVERLDELLQGRTIKLNVYMGRLGLLEACEGADIAHKHTEQKILDIIALGCHRDTLDLLLKGILGPLGDAREEILECLEGLLGLTIPITGSLGVVVDAPQTICDVGDENTGEILTHRLFDELSGHLFRERMRVLRKRRTMKVVLILMVRNEERILQRCLEAVEDAVDAFCIHDTGSTDKTLEIANTFLATHPGCLTVSEWKNFGHNRTMSFRAARDYLAGAGWDLATTYGLLLDGDMVLRLGTLRSEELTEVGYTLIQKGGDLEYPNCRLVRMDYEWTCKGVTHEYWDGPAKHLGKSVAWIDDRNDGGCKSDKFERDARLLEDGLKSEPENVRYMFYLAQTYHSLGRFRDAIAMYKKRFKAGGWVEEQWYSLYMIGQSWLALDYPIKFESYMLKAYAFRPGRAEPVYKLAKYFREKGEQYKAFQYLLMGKDIPLSTDSLFIETPVYTHLFRYEETILLYYVKRTREGLRKSIEYMMSRSEYSDVVYKNIGFYIEPIGTMFRNHPVQRDTAGRDYHPSSVCSFEGGQNVRFVNYSITNTGSYDMRDGHYSANHKVRTQNVLWTPTESKVLNDASVSLPRRDVRICGLEDVRVYKDLEGDLRFVGVSSEYSEAIRIVAGRYNVDSASYSDCRVIESPLSAGCEKNWIPVNGTNDIIYSWNPLRVGHLEESTLVFDKEITTPWFFQHLRGSAVPVRVKNELWCLVHFVEYSTPRKYFHCIVVLEPTTYKPLRMSLPFVFRDHGIEYCISVTAHESELQFTFSSWDDNPTITDVPMDAFEWIHT